MPDLDKQKLVDDLKSLIGTQTRWRHQGRDPRVGLDCVGLPVWAFSQQMELPAELLEGLAAYHRRPDGLKLLRTLQSWFDEVDQMEMGDLICLRDKRNPQHIAIACDAVNVIECYSSGSIMKVVYWPLGTWRELAGVFRFPTEGARAEKWQR
jgi:cell wall-associated NlpC family hydrolase